MFRRVTFHVNTPRLPKKGKSNYLEVCEIFILRLMIFMIVDKKYELRDLLISALVKRSNVKVIFIH